MDALFDLWSPTPVSASMKKTKRTSFKKVVDAHKGKIYFKTEAGKGTVFFVEIRRNG